ncbi:MAG: four-carbon acid sugar kinase family protein [Lachnospiraceae bacterium]
MKGRYFIIADDFTGANDTGVQLCRRGYPTEVLFAGKTFDWQKSVVVDTESRTAHSDHAYEIVAQTLKGVDFAGFRNIIKKVDSTMRGNIAQEVWAVDEAYHPDLIVFAPAFPNMGRTTVDGVQRLHGKEICQTELAKDPKNPVKEDHLDRILSQVYQETINRKYLADVRSTDFHLLDGRIFVCDAETNEDLIRIIHAAKELPGKTLYIGTAGLVDNLMEIESPVHPVLAVVASISSVTNEQMRYCEENGYTMVRIPVHELLAGQRSVEEFRHQAVSALKRGKDTVLLTNTAYNRDQIELSALAGKKRGMSLSQVGNYVRSVVGKMAADILEEVAVSGVFLTGGDTALGVLMNIGADGSEMLSEIQVGMPMVRVKGGRFEGMKIVTKAGAFGEKDSVTFAIRKLKEASL